MQWAFHMAVGNDRSQPAQHRWGPAPEQLGLSDFIYLFIVKAEKRFFFCEIADFLLVLLRCGFIGDGSSSIVLLRMSHGDVVTRIRISGCILFEGYRHVVCIVCS